MSDQDSRQASAIRRPSTEDTEVWKAHWQAQRQPWRTRPEIDIARQEELAQYRKIAPDIEKGRYPFKDVKLSRADVEWLLSTHESGGMRGLVDCSDERQREREGLDVRGARLQEENLGGLPLARIRGGLTLDECMRSSKEQREMAAVHLQEAKLWKAKSHGMRNEITTIKR